MNDSVKGIELSNLNVDGNINISGVTVYGYSAQHLVDEIRKLRKNHDSSHDKVYLSYKDAYFYASMYINELRERVGNLVKTEYTVAVIEFLKSFVEYIRIERSTNWEELIDCLTNLAILERLHGQHLQITAAREANRAENFSLTPAVFHLKRENLVARGIDQRHFQKAGSHIYEALKLSNEKFGPGYFQEIILRNELALLHRDKGDYRTASKQFRENMALINRHHRSEKLQLAACYFNWALVLREQRRHLNSLYFFWSTSVLEDAAEAFRASTYMAIRQQKVFCFYYFGFSLLLLIIWSFLVGFVVDGVLISVVLGAAGVTLYRLVMFFFGEFAAIFVSSKALGWNGLNWPPLMQSGNFELIMHQFNDSIVRLRVLNAEL